MSLMQSIRLHGLWWSLKNGPLFYWRIGKHGSNRGRCYFIQLPWFTLWFLWKTSWCPDENGKFLFTGMVVEYRLNGDWGEYLLAIKGDTY